MYIIELLFLFCNGEHPFKDKLSKSDMKMELSLKKL